jgi:ATP-dependent DNA helicase RecG
LKIGYFETNVNLRYQDEVTGDLIFQVNQALEVLKTKYLRAWISYEGLQRIESWPVPMPALREAVLNAVVHKDYAIGAPIQISVYPDKLLIWNPGELPPNWTVEKLLSKHASIPFNPDVASVFFRAGMIESWGRGIGGSGAGTYEKVYQRKAALYVAAIWLGTGCLRRHCPPNRPHSPQIHCESRPSR